MQYVKIGGKKDFRSEDFFEVLFPRGINLTTIERNAIDRNMNREDQILNWVKDGLNGFSDELEGYRVVLFGSRVRGDQHDRSDFDLGIMGANPITLSTFYRISDFLEQLPTLYQIDWVDLNRASDSFRNTVLKDAEVIYG